MMLTFERDGTKALVKVTGPLGYVYGFAFHCSDEPYAELLVWHLQRKFSNAVSEARREAYCRGWQHAKAKKHPKEDWFSGWLP